MRQSFINWLINQKGYPVSLMANEVSIHLNENLLRCDTVIFSSDQTAPQIIIEYKAPYIEISQDVFNQIVAYNMVLQVKYLIVTNGITHYCCEIDYFNFTYSFLKEIPSYHSL